MYLYFAYHDVGDDGDADVLMMLMNDDMIFMIWMVMTWVMMMVLAFPGTVDNLSLLPPRTMMSLQSLPRPLAFVIRATTNGMRGCVGHSKPPSRLHTRSLQHQCLPKPFHLSTTTATLGIPTASRRCTSRLPTQTVPPYSFPRT